MRAKLARVLQVAEALFAFVAALIMPGVAAYLLVQREFIGAIPFPISLLPPLIAAVVLTCYGVDRWRAAFPAKFPPPVESQPN
jgi:hypothetical protein